MHSKGIAHRDLKPENILLKDNVVKIGDLGTAKKIDTRLNTPYVVSRYYRCPDLILASNYYGVEIDIWAFGCILFELLTITPLFNSQNEGFTLFEITRIIGPPSDSEII